MTRGRYRVALGALVAADVLLRLWVAAAIPSRPISDFAEYFATARSLLESGRYEIAPGNPDANHPPAYPLLLEGAMRLAPAGEELLALRTVKIVNAALSGLAVLLGATLARRLGGPAAGLWTAGWIAFFPRSLLSADLVASENLFAPLLLLFLLLCTVSWSGGRRPALAIAIGLVVGALALTRSVAYLLPVVWLLGALAARRRPRTCVVELLLILAVQHAVMLPWAVRNARVIGRFTFLNGVGGIGLFIGNNPNATGHWYPWAGELERLRPGVHARGIAAVDAAAREEAWRWIRENPGRAATLYAHKLRLILTDDADAANFAIYVDAVSPSGERVVALPGPHPLKAHAAALRAILRVSGLLLAAAGLGGWVLLARVSAGPDNARALAVGFAAAALYVPLLSAAIAVSGRYRWPTEDVLMPLAGLLSAWVTSQGDARAAGGALSSPSAARARATGTPPSPPA